MLLLVHKIGFKLKTYILKLIFDYRYNPAFAVCTFKHKAQLFIVKIKTVIKHVSDRIAVNGNQTVACRYFLFVCKAAALHGFDCDCHFSTCRYYPIL